MEEFKITELIDGRPQEIKNDKEKECYDILDKLDIQYQRVEYNFFPSDKDNLEKIDKTLQVEGIKNLIFKSKNKDEFYFIIIFFSFRKFKIFIIQNTNSKNSFSILWYSIIFSI